MIRPSSLRGAPGLLLVTLLAPALAGCGAASRDTVLSCATDLDCGPGARCAQGACQASTPPLADFAPPAGLTTNRAVQVTGTAHDPDPGDAVVAWAWTITPLSAGCDADADVADGATLQAVFWCAGTYELALVVTDTAGVESAPARRTVSVATLPDAPVVTAGPPVAVEHRCAGAPLRCQLESPVALSAAGQAPLGGVLTYRWSAVAPDATRAAATASLSPSDASPDATLALTTDGGPISGTWRLRVRVRDGHDNLAQAVQLVTVGNRPPAVDATPMVVDHRHEGGIYRADGPAVLPVIDPDGDPLEVTLELVEPAGSGCAASLTGVGGAPTAFSIACPGPTGLLASGRALRASAVDVNGASVTALVPLQVRNRVPVVRPAAGGDVLELHHVVGPCPDGSGPCFLVGGANPFVAEDPDGDPVTAVTLVPGVEAGRPHAFGLSEPGPSGGFLFGTPVGHPAEFRAASGASGFWLTATASDPFGASAPAQPALAIRVLNRPPTVALATTAVTVAHRYDEAAAEYRAEALLSTFEDPDGDPLVDAGSTGDESCGAVTLSGGAASVTCRRAFQVTPTAYPTLSGFAGTHQVTPRVGDGWESVAAPAAVTIASAAPTVPSYTGAIESCTCRCPRWDPDAPNICAEDPTWVADPAAATFPVRPADADGDPLAVTFSSTAVVSPTALTGLPGACTTKLAGASLPAVVQVTVNDGVSQATGTWTATQVTCAKAGAACQLPVTPLRR